MTHSVYSDTEKFKRDNSLLKRPLPFSEDTAVLGESVNIGKFTVHNRLACQAMEGCDGTADGRPDELTKRRYERFANGGAGVIWFEATAVMPEGRANPRQLYIDESNLDDFKAMVEKIRSTCLLRNGYEPLIIMQATHSGRYSKPQGVPAPLIAYNNPIFEKDAPIDESRIVDDAYLDRVCDALVEGSRLAQKAGFDGVDIKCAHRYLNCELLSAYERGGRYGGSFENRTRLLRESVLGAIQNCDSDFLVTSRLNVYDGFPYPYGFGVREGGGIEFDKDEPIKLIKTLASYGVKLLNITMGNPYFNPHVNRPFAKGAYEPPEHPLEGVARMLLGTADLKTEVPDMKIISSGFSYLGTVAPHVASGLVKTGGTDIAGFGREAFAYPDFARDILSGGGLDPKKICVCCSECTSIMRAGGTPGCVIRDRDPYLEIYRKYCGGRTK